MLLTSKSDNQFTTTVQLNKLQKRTRTHAYLKWKWRKCRWINSLTYLYVYLDTHVILWHYMLIFRGLAYRVQNAKSEIAMHCSYVNYETMHLCVFFLILFSCVYYSFSWLTQTHTHTLSLSLWTCVRACVCVYEWVNKALVLAFTVARIDDWQPKWNRLHRFCSFHIFYMAVFFSLIRSVFATNFPYIFYESHELIYYTLR